MGAEQYFNAQMSLREEDGIVNYTSHPTHRGAVSADFAGGYAPSGEVFQSVPGSIDVWLTERYSLYTVHNGRAFRGDIHHEPWPLQPAEADVVVNTVAAASQIALGFSQKLNIRVLAGKANSRSRNQQNTYIYFSGMALPDVAALLHFARELDVVVWPLVDVATEG